MLPSSQPQPDVTEDQVSEESVYGDRMKMIAGGLSALGMVYGGLQSFDQWGELFGEYGEAAAEPMQAIRDFIEEGKRRYQYAGGGTSAKARAALMASSNDPHDIDSEGESLTDRVREYAREDEAMEKRLRGMSQAMTDVKVNTALAGMAGDIADDSTDQAREARIEERAGRIKQDFINERSRQISRRDKYREKYGGQRYTPGTNPDDVNPVFRAIEAAEQGGTDPFIDNLIHGQEEVNQEYGYPVFDTGPFTTDADERRQASERALHNQLANPTPEEMFPGADTTNEELARRAHVLAEAREGNLLDAAYRRYQDRYPLEDMPDDVSQEDLLLRERMDPAFHREVQRTAGEPTRGKEEAPMPADFGLEGVGPYGPSAGRPRMADPTQSRAYKEADISAIATGVAGDDAMTLFESGKGSVVDELAARAEQKIQWAVDQANKQIRRTGNQPEYDFTMQRVRVDDHHEVFQGRLKQGEDVHKFEVPILSSQKGTYMSSEQERPIVHPLQQLLTNDMYRTGEQMSGFRTIEQRRKSLVARPDEIALLKIGNFTNKLLNDLRGGRAEGGIEFLEDRVIGDSFKAKSFANTSIQDTFKKSLEVRSGIEPLFEAARDNPNRRQDFEQGLESLENMRRMFGMGSRYFSPDSEFVSPETMGEAGVAGRAKTPFEVAGSIVDPNTDTSLAAIRYRADLSNATSDYSNRVRDEVHNIYQELSGKTEEQADQLVNKMESGGELVVRLPGEDGTFEEIDLLGGNTEKIKGIDWLPERKGDSVERYYMRVQNAMLDKFGAEFSVGQNYVDAEHTVFDNLARSSEVDLHSSITDQNVVDVMKISHVMDPNTGMNSHSLGSITAATFGLDHDVYSDTRQAFADMLELHQKAQEGAANADTNKRQVRDYTLRKLRGREGGVQKGQKMLVNRLASLMDEIGDMDPHTAEFDAFVTGRVALPRLEHFARQPEGEIAEKRIRDVLNLTESFAGDRQAVERYGEMSYGGFSGDGDREEGPVPFFSNQEAATMGRGVLVNPRMLPFARLQNPARQLYQRMKPRELLGTRHAQTGQYVDFGGTALQRRARLPSKNEQKKLKYQERMQNFRQGGDPNVSGPLETSEEAPVMFAGSGAATPRQRQIFGGYSNELQHAVTSRVAYLPNNHRAIYESRGQTTAVRREAMEAVPDMQSASTTVDLTKIGLERGKGASQQVSSDNPYGSKDMRQWVETRAQEMGIHGKEGPNGNPLNIHENEKGREALKEAYQLAQIKENAPSGLADEAHNIINQAIGIRYARAKGQSKSRNEIMRSALRKSRRGDSSLDIGSGAELFHPDADGGGIVKDPLNAPGNARLVGIDASVRRRDDHPDQLVMHFIEDPGDTYKEITNQAKVGQFGTRTQPVVGMAGEQAAMEAAFMKSKRRDFSGYPRAQIERLYNKAVQDMQELSMQGKGRTLADREQILERFSESVSKMTGGKISTNEVRNDVVRDKMGGERYADYFEIDYTDNLTRALEENTSVTRMMAASKEMGLSLRHVFRQGSDMLAQFEGDKRQRRKKLARLLRDQVTAEIEKIQEFNEPGNIEKYFGKHGNPLGEKEKAEMKKTVKKLKKQQETLDKLYEGKIQDLSDDRLDEGSLWDFFVDAESGSVSTAFQSLSAGHNVQSPATGASGLGEDFESRVGRATVRKRSSLLSSALVGHSASQTLGALGDKERMAAETFQGWLASKSGAAAFSERRFQRKVYEAMQRHGSIQTKKWFDLDRIEKKDDGTYYYDKPEGGEEPLESYVQKRFEWNPEEGTLTFKSPNGGSHELAVDAFTTLRDTRRKQAGVLGMITGELQTGNDVGGTPIGGDGRTLQLVFGQETDIQEGRISAQDFHELFGKKTRAQQHFQHTKIEEPTPYQQRKFDGRYVYFGENARPAAYAGGTSYTEKLQQTIFNENFDFLEVSLFGDLTGGQEQEITQALRKAGVSDEMISRTLMGGTVVEKALTNLLPDDAVQERSNIQDTVDYLRKSNETGGRSIFLETRTGGNSPDLTSIEGGVKRANIGQWADLADKLDPEGLDAIGKVQSSVKRIEETAARLKDKHGTLDKRAAQRELKRVFDQEFKSTVDSGAFTEVEEFFAQTLRRSAKGLVSQMEELEGRYLGGEYKLSTPQVDMMGKFESLAERMTPGEGISEGFREEVAQMMRNSRPDLAQSNMDQFNDIVDDAAGDLHSYMREQMSEFGEEMHRWRGFGVGEGFIGRSTAEKVLDQLEDSHKGLKKSLNHIDDPTSVQAQAKERVKQLERIKEAGGVEGSAREVSIARQEVNNPGSTPGLIMMSTRQPDYTAAGGYEMSRLTSLGDNALKAMGMDSDQVHTFSHPLAMWSRKEDFDYDLNYLAAVDDSVNAHFMRETRAQSMPNHLANLFEMVEGKGADVEGLGPGPATDRFTSEVDKVQVDGETVETSRVTTEYGGENMFRDSVASFFSAPGLALKAATRGRDARTKYALQQSILGQFGAYSKQGAVQTKQRINAFTDMMSSLNRQAEKMVESGQMTEAEVKRSFSEMFNKRSSSVVGEGGPRDSWKYMQQTYESVKKARAQQTGPGGAADLLHTAALTEGEITQAVAVEKYKYGDAQQVSRRINNIMQTLHGNHSGGYQSFDEAFEDLMGEDSDIAKNLPFHPAQEFGDVDAAPEEKRRIAKKAFRLQYDQNRAMRMAARAGIGSDYMSSFANVAADEVPTASQIGMADPKARSKVEARNTLQTVLPNEAAQALSSGDAGEATRDFFAAEQARSRHLERIIGTPSTMTEKMTQVLNDLPIGGRGIAAAAAGGAALLGMGMQDVESRAGAEQYDTPRRSAPAQAPPRHGNPQTSSRVTRLRERRRQESSWAQMSSSSSGLAVQPQRPPTIQASF